MEKLYEQLKEKFDNTNDLIGANFLHLSKGDYWEQYAANEGISWWTNGFWPGILWLMYIETGDEKYRKTAEQLEEKLDEALDLFDGLHHDVGFMWLPTSVINYKLTGNERSKTRAMHAATLLAGRFNPVGEYIRAWNGEGDKAYAIIDCMLNIPLLYWASETTGDMRFKNIAMKHADTVMREFIREDGSSNHIVIFNPETGKAIEKPGGQGYAPGSSWTRGQAWALYGFTKSYIYTGKKEYLETAEKSAKYFMSNLPEDAIPPSDFSKECDWSIKDASAGACAASGLVYLAKATGKNEYLDDAKRIIAGLSKVCDFSKDTPLAVQKCSCAYHDKERHDVGLVYADYFLFEALMKLKDIETPDIF